MARIGNGTGTHASIPVVAARPEDFGEEPTEPGVDVVVSNRVLYKLIQGLSRRITALAVSVLLLAGAVFMFGLFLLWSRPQ